MYFSVICSKFSWSILQYETHLLADQSLVVEQMVQEFGHVTCHLEYLNSVLTAMFEAWDDLLFNLDSQLEGFAKVKHYTQFFCYTVFSVSSITACGLA